MAFSLSSGGRWLTHPMGAITVLDLTRGHLAKHASEGPVLIADAVTLFVWVEWRPANTPARVAWRGPDEVPIAVEDGSRRLGVYVSESAGKRTKPTKGTRRTADEATIAEEAGEGGEERTMVRFLHCGYNVSVAGWQLVVVVRRAFDRSSSSSDAAMRSVRTQGAKEVIVDYTFFVNGYKVRSLSCIDRHARTHTHTHTHARAHTHTHTHTCQTATWIYIFQSYVYMYIQG